MADKQNRGSCFSCLCSTTLNTCKYLSELQTQDHLLTLPYLLSVPTSIYIALNWCNRMLPLFPRMLCVITRLGKVVHHDGFRRPARSDSSTLQRFVWANAERTAGGGELHCWGVLHGDLQREGPRSAGSQRVRPLVDEKERKMRSFLI